MFKGQRMPMNLSYSYCNYVYDSEYINLTNKVTFINCGQGDSSLVEIKDKKVISAELEAKMKEAYKLLDNIVNRNIKFFKRVS